MKHLVYIFLMFSATTFAATSSEIGKDNAIVIYYSNLAAITEAGCATEAVVVNGSSQPEDRKATYTLIPESGNPIILSLAVERGGTGAHVVAVSCDGSENSR